MKAYSYLAVLAAIVLGTLWLEFFLRTRVLRRMRRLSLTILPVLIVFLAWDLYAIESGHWSFSSDFVTQLRVGAIPIEEVLFFVVIPLASVLTLEAVRSARGWSVGDETADPKAASSSHQP